MLKFAHLLKNMSPYASEGPKENLGLEGKVSIVTGAASGIGRAIAIRFAQEGAMVAILDINEEGAKKVAQEIGEQAIAIKTDVRDPKRVTSGVEKVIKKFGQIDILVNNAGINRPLEKGILAEGTQEAWEEVISTNLTGPFLMTEQVVKVMLERQGNWRGNIINITSVQSQIPVVNGAHYPAAKAGLLAATRCWALELAPLGIRVNALAPGAIMETAMNPQVTLENEGEMAKHLNIPFGRWGRPEEIADAAVFLATHPYITGHELVVDGGFTLTH